jgi:hypothetical protein
MLLEIKTMLDLKFLTSSIFISSIAITAFVISIICYTKLKDAESKAAEKQARYRHDIHNNEIKYLGKPTDFTKVSNATSRSTLGVGEFATLGTINMPVTNVSADVHLSFRVHFDTDVTTVVVDPSLNKYTMNDFDGTPTLYVPSLNIQCLLVIGDNNYTAHAQFVIASDYLSSINGHPVSHGISVIFPGVSLTTASTATLKIKIINLFDQGFSSTYDQTNSITVTNNFGDKLCAPPSMAIVSNCTA